MVVIQKISLGGNTRGVSGGKKKGEKGHELAKMFPVPGPHGNRLIGPKRELSESPGQLNHSFRKRRRPSIDLLLSEYHEIVKGQGGGRSRCRTLRKGLENRRGGLIQDI